MRSTLLIAGCVALLVGFVYLHIAHRFAWRPQALGHTRAASLQFALWWAATGANIALAGLLYAAAAFDRTSLTIQVSYTVIQRLLLALSLYGLVSYLVFLLTGRRSGRPLAFAYGAYFLFSAYTVVALEPVGVYVGAWRTDLVYAQSSSPWASLASLVWVVLPTLGGTLAGVVVALANRRIDRERRLRLGMVCGALAVWWVVAVVAGQHAARGLDDFQFVNRFLGLAAALVVLAAYEPAFARWWRHGPLREAAPAPH